MREREKQIEGEHSRKTESLEVRFQENTHREWKSMRSWQKLSERECAESKASKKDKEKMRQRGNRRGKEVVEKN